MLTVPIVTNPFAAGPQDRGRPPVHPDCDPHAAAVLPPGRAQGLQRGLPQEPGQVRHRRVMEEQQQQTMINLFLFVPSFHKRAFFRHLPSYILSFL